MPTVQILFARPEAMQVRWDVGGVGLFDSTPLIVPGRQNFPSNGIFRMKITAIPGREGVAQAGRRLLHVQLLPPGLGRRADREDGGASVRREGHGNANARAARDGLHRAESYVDPTTGAKPGGTLWLYDFRQGTYVQSRFEWEVPVSTTDVTPSFFLAARIISST